MGISQLFIIGDSISMQYGPFLRHALLGKMEVLRKGDLPGEENIDANGRDSIAVLGYLGALVERGFKTNLLMVNSGLHDVKRIKPTDSFQVEPAVYLANLEAIIHITSIISDKMIWISSTPVDDERHNRLNPDFQRYNADVIRYNAIAQSVMTGAGIPIIDLFRFTSRLADEVDLYEDHVHFLEPIRKVQADYLAGCIQLICDAERL